MKNYMYSICTNVCTATQIKPAVTVTYSKLVWANTMYAATLNILCYESGFAIESKRLDGSVLELNDDGNVMAVIATITIRHLHYHIGGIIFPGMSRFRSYVLEVWKVGNHIVSRFGFNK